MKLVIGGVKTKREFTVVTMPPKRSVGYSFITLAENLGETTPSKKETTPALIKTRQRLFKRKAIPPKLINELAMLFNLPIETLRNNLVFKTLPNTIATVIKPDNKEIFTGLEINIKDRFVWIKRTKIGVKPPKKPSSKESWKRLFKMDLL